MDKNAFSFVELIVVTTILLLLAIVGGAVNSDFKNKTQNTRTVADIETLNNALKSYAQESGTLPFPSGNTNWFGEDASYKENSSIDAFGVYGQVTEATLPRKYLNFLPLDQRTWAYFAYGKMVTKNEFELAAVVREDGNAQAIVAGNYTAEQWPYNLIREYNWPDFIFDGSESFFPYNPDELVLNARINALSFSGYSVGQTVGEWSVIIVPAGETLTLYFADGSKSVLWDPSQETKITLGEMNYPNDHSLASKISLFLEAGTVWTNVTQLGKSSEFTISTADTTAAVRGTIFGMNASGAVEVTSWKVLVTKHGTTTTVTPLNCDIVPSIDSSIQQGYWKLSQTLRTEVIRHDGQTKTVTLKMFDTFIHDAEYLQAGTQQIQNDGSWTNPEQSFVLTDTTTEIPLKFCKTNQAGWVPICTRETSVASRLSFERPDNDDTLQTSICSPSSADVAVWSLSNHTYSFTDSFSGFKVLEHIATDSHHNKEHYSIQALCEDGAIHFEKERLVRLECNLSENYHLNASGDDCIRQLVSCQFNGKSYQDGEQIWAYQYETSATCAERTQKTCDGASGNFDYPAYTKPECNKRCVPPSGRQLLSWPSKVAHGEANTMSVYRYSSDGNSTVKWVKLPTTGDTCDDGVLRFQSELAHWTEYSSIKPWTFLGDLPQAETANLGSAFTITIELNRLPTIGKWGAKQYVLYEPKANQDLKLFFANADYTGYKDKLCFQKEASDDRDNQCVAPSTYITISRDESNNIWLNHKDTGLNLSNEYGDSMIFWAWLLGL